jgi:hypothetical protein
MISAAVQVSGLTPPTVKPKPSFCTAVAVAPKSIYVGQLGLLTLRISQHSKAIAGIHIRIKVSTRDRLTSPRCRRSRAPAARAFNRRERI